MKKIINKIKIEIAHKYWLKYVSTKLEQFRNKHDGEDCFIIGNGPSLNKMDLTLLNDYNTFGLNKIYMIFNRMAFNLTYHVAVNPYVIKQSKKEFINLNCPSFLAYIPAKNNNIKSNNIHYLGDINTNKFFSKDITQGIRQGCTVTYVAMQLAYFMGFKRVYLIGVDHKFKQSGNPHDVQILTENDPNHFDPNYFKGQKWQLADIESIELSYLIAKYYFNKDGREIIDATIDGKLNIYNKMNFDECLLQAKKK
ncbi:MAG: DUF115 domain-containing protein [Planctomycetia bacterium]|nr:DUF115 domain-containing protein [Planctomycetia bacterium]